MDPAIVLPLAIFVALAALFAVVLRRAGSYLAETRENEGFRRSVADLARRAEVSLDGVAERIDAVRRHQLPPGDIEPNLAAARDAVERYLTEAEGIEGGDGYAAVREGVVAELERAGRALEMVEHGCRLMAQVRGGYPEAEAQTAIKRGYLNVLHAREAITRRAAELAAPLGSAGERWLSLRRRA